MSLKITLTDNSKIFVSLFFYKTMIVLLTNYYTVIQQMKLKNARVNSIHVNHGKWNENWKELLKEKIEGQKAKGK